MDKLVSIVLPVYNGEAFLDLAIDSVRKQTYKNLELIVVNDCSTDSTEEIVLRHKQADDRIVYIKNEENFKLPRSLNVGFKNARGDYYSWTSDDNLYHPDAIKTMVEALERDRDAAFVACDNICIDVNGTEGDRTSAGKENILFRNNIGACFLYRKEVPEKIGEYDPERFLVEDYEYWLRIFFNFKMIYIHTPLYFYRRHDNSLTIKKKSDIAASLTKLRWDILPLCEQKLPRKELFEYYDFLIYNENDAEKADRIRRSFIKKHKTYYFKPFIDKSKSMIKRLITFSRRKLRHLKEFIKGE